MWLAQQAILSFLITFFFLFPAGVWLRDVHETRVGPCVVAAVCESCLIWGLRLCGLRRADCG